MMLPEYKNKMIDTNIAKFGYKAPTQSHISHIEEWYEFTNSPREFINTHFDTTPRTAEIAAYFGVDDSTIDEYLNKYEAFINL